jgi:hypothetical protein
MVSPSAFGLTCDLRSSSLSTVERILRQQQEARIAAAAEAERLQKEREKARQSAPKPSFPSDSEKASLASLEAKSSAPTLVPPVAAGAPTSSFARHLQNIKRRTGLGSNQEGHNHPPAVPEKKPQAGLESASPATSPPPVVLHAPKPLPERPPVNDEYALNKQYLSAAERVQGQSRSRSRTPETSAAMSDDEAGSIPGGFGKSPTSGVGGRGVGAGPITPLSNICKFLKIVLVKRFGINFGCARTFFLARNIDLAIDSCRPESANLLQNRQAMQRVKESLDDGYCDISGRKENLHNIGTLFLLPRALV